MPIKPANKSRYPKDWKAIRKEVLERAGHKCEQCGVPNYAWRVRYTGEWSMDEYAALDMAGYGDTDGNGRITRIVLTIAHLNHDPSDCGEPGNRPNLKALCQRDHLAWDKEHHLRNSWYTRRAKKGNAELF